jgi:4-amino-4-deoxy-L-arabinose transferase-like glycosyltransferase
LDGRSLLYRSAGWLVPISFFCIVYWLMPLKDVLQFDPDEGIELAKVTLLSQGYRLYAQVWNDQPPLLTILLSEWFKLFGTNIEAARILILSFSTLLVGAFYQTLRFSLGMGSALLGTTALCLTLNFLRLSVSVMRGLPAIALAMLGIYFVLLATALPLGKPDYQQQSRWRPGLATIASGICCGLSLQIKFFAVLLFPACFLHLLLGWRWHQQLKKPTTQRWSITLLWLFVCSVTFVGVGLATQSFSLDQLLVTHLDGATQGSLQREPSWQLLLMFLAQDLDYSLLAGIGIWQLLRDRNMHVPTLPLTWLVTVLSVLTFYQPLWYHYYPLLSIPVVWLATHGLTQSYSFIHQKQWFRQIHWSKLRPISGRGLASGFLILAIVLAPIKFTILVVQNHLFVQDSVTKAEIIQQVQAYRSQTRWLFTDLPIVSFYTGIKVPPELAVFSTKRLKSDSLGIPKLLQILETYRPEQVLLGRYPKVEKGIQSYLDKSYVKLHTKDKITQYVLKTIAPFAAPRS